MRTALAASRAFRKYTTDTASPKASGAVLPYVILTTLMIFIGVVLLATRNSESNLSSARQSDYNTAREAAEFGMAQTISAMNSASRGYLWVTKLANWSTITTSELDACMIKHSGFQSGSTLLGKKTLPGIGTASYELTNFVEPQIYVTRSTCNKFGNLIGGSATITITGRVERAANSPAATYQLSRRIHVIGPTVGGLGEFPLIILGAGSEIKKADNDFVQAESPDTNINQAADLSIACLSPLNTCFAAGGAPATNGTKVQPIGSLPIPGFPSTPTSVSALSPSSIDIADTEAGEFSKFPYQQSDTNQTLLHPSCILTSNIIWSSGGTEISCHVRYMRVTDRNSSFKINTSAYPVNIFLTGTSSDPTLSHADPDINQSSLYVALGTYIGSKEVIDNVDPRAWSRLRFFGVNNNDNSANCGTQKLQISASAALQGAFSWFPNATISYGVGGGGGASANNFGILWVCKFVGPSSENQGYGARLDSPDGLGDIFGPAFSGISDQSAVTGIPASPHYYRGYGTSE